MKAKVNVGDVIIDLPVEYLEQQTAVSSVFDNVPMDNVEVSALIEANRTMGLTWYQKSVIGEDRKVLHVSIPTGLIEWAE